MHRDDYRRTRPLRIYCDVVRDDVAGYHPFAPPGGLHACSYSAAMIGKTSLNIWVDLSALGEMWDTLCEKVRFEPTTDTGRFLNIERDNHPLGVPQEDES